MATSGLATIRAQCPSCTISTVILNPVKDLRLPLRVSPCHYFREGGYPLSYVEVTEMEACRE
jgi:hypothetical protein